MSQLDTQINLGGYAAQGTRPDQRSMMIAGAMITILLHASIVAAMVWAAFFAGPDAAKAQPPMLKFQQVELLALGEKKPPGQLPRIANPAPPEPKENVVNLAKPKEKPPEKPEKPEKKPPPKTNDRRAEMLKQLDTLHNPNRPSNEVVPEGSDKGVASGTVSDAALANMMNTYQARLLQTLARYWRVPTTLGDAEIKKLAGTVAVYVRLSPDGHVITYRFLKKSANAQFNGSIDRVLRRFEVSGGRQLPVPTNPQLRDLVLREGLNMRNWKAITQR